MEKYEQLSTVGEGSYGLVMKCRHRETDQIVAIKKFLETEEDPTVRRMALREIRMLKRLRHENLVSMIEVFRHKKRFYLVFEYLEGTVLDELEKYPDGLGNERTRERIYQVIRAIQYCHANHIIHRDVKPENVLVSTKGIVKLCDFGFARLIGGSGEGYTEYVATRWYRAPELLVGENHYGAPVDIWAIGCLFSEMMTGEPLFPGESDIDQLYLIVKLIGKPCSRHQQLMTKNAHLKAIKRASATESDGLTKVFPHWSLCSVDFLSCCTKMDPQYRPTADDLLKHNYFTHDRFPDRFLPALRDKVRIELSENPLLRKYKADLFIPVSDSKKEEVKPKRSSQYESPKWKINFLQGSIKRKYSCDTQNSDDNKTLISINKNVVKYSTTNSSTQKLSQMSKTHSLQTLKRDEKMSSNTSEQSRYTYIVPSRVSQERSDTSKYSSQKENPRLEKALDLLSKLNKKNQYCRPKSTTKDSSHYSSQLTSPPEFSSLQAHSFREISKSPQTQQNVLHPTITNISFSKELKNSPHLIQSVNNLSLKSVFHQVPMSNPPKTHYLKKIDRYMGVDNMSANQEQSLVHHSSSDWISSVGTHKKRDPWKVKSSDDFTLPTVPGAVGSPSRMKKKQTPEHHFDNTMQTPIKKQNLLSYRVIDLKLKSPFSDKKVNG